MTTVSDITKWMNQQAPLELSESWDNTGLLVGDTQSAVAHLQTCLTLTRETVEEAIDGRADLVIAHHPLPFKPIARLTTQSTTGWLLWKLCNHHISVYCPHTAWDSAEYGINAMLTQTIGLSEVAPLIPSSVPGFQSLGSGRIGKLENPTNLSRVTELLRTKLPNCRLRGVDVNRPIRKVAIGCGSGASLLSAAHENSCDLFITGEATFHQCLEAQHLSISMLLVGHFASEQFAMVELASRIRTSFPQVNCWASRRETDPVRDFQAF